MFFFLIVFPAYSQKKNSIQVINLKVAADEEFRETLNWQLVIKKQIAFASNKFEKKFGIQFKMKKIVYWNSDNSLHSMLGLLNDLRKKISKGDYDIVLGFSGQPHLEYKQKGIASYPKCYAFVRKTSPSLSRRIILHELCHLFGAIDLDEKGSIMDKTDLGEELDSFTTQIIRLNKNRLFDTYHFPLNKELRSKAIILYNQRKRLNKMETGIHIHLSSIYLENKDYDSMIRECQEALSRDPELYNVHHLLGIAYKKKGMIDQAITQSKKTLQFHPSLPEAYYNLGIAYMKKELFTKAIKMYRKAIELNPFYAKAYLNLGYVYLQMEMADESIQLCQNALNLYPRYAEALSTLGAALILKGNYPEAEQYSLKALKIKKKPGTPGGI